MQVDELPAIDSNVDYTQIVPIDQKRTIAFINHFIMNTVSFLNQFSQSCESRLMGFEYKLQKVEASLLIIESQLSSIPGLEDVVKKSENEPVKVEETKEVPQLKAREDEKLIEPTVVAETNDKTDSSINQIETSKAEDEGIKACDDPRFKKFFKMVQFGVPAAAVKLKMQSEKLDPNILDTPNAIIPGGDQLETAISDPNSSDEESD